MCKISSCHGSYTFLAMGFTPISPARPHRRGSSCRNTYTLVMHVMIYIHVYVPGPDVELQMIPVATAQQWCQSVAALWGGVQSADHAVSLPGSGGRLGAGVCVRESERMLNAMSIMHTS